MVRAAWVVGLGLMVAVGGCVDATTPAPSSAAAPASGGSIAVTVTTSEIMPVEGAEVVLADTGHVGFTDAAGAVTFTGLEAGVYTVLAAKPGYRPLHERGRAAQVDPDELVEVKLQLDPVVVASAKNTYQVTLPFRGFISCSFHITLIGYTSYCGRGVTVGGQDIGRDPNDNSTHPWRVENPFVQGIILEASWTPTNAALGEYLFIQTGSTFACDAYHCSVGNGFQSASGKSPLRAVRIEGPKQNLTNLFGTDASKFPRPVWSEARAFLCSGCSHDILINQRYEMYATSFYGQEPDPAFTALPK